MKLTTNCLLSIFCAATLMAPGATQWWDVATNNNLTPGTGVWSTVDSYWASSSAPGTNAPAVAELAGYQKTMAS